MASYRLYRESRRVALQLEGRGSAAQFVPINLDGSARFVTQLCATGEIVLLIIKIKSERT